jgi:uncharacterized tellurite resistance protein B-like protein
MNFEHREKLAIIRVLEKVAKADDKIMEEEMQILLNAAKYLDVHEDQIQASKEMTLHEAGDILSGLHHEKREFLNTTLLNLMASDGVIDPVEVRILMDAFFGEEED